MKMALAEMPRRWELFYFGVAEIRIDDPDIVVRGSVEPARPRTLTATYTSFADADA